jgi:hypothetical protein
VLTGGEENDNGEVAEAGDFNLYYHGDGATRFIGGLHFADNFLLGFLGTYGAWHASAGARTAQVSPGGRYLAFMSEAPLTGYDNRSRGNYKLCPLGTSCQEVFQYDAVTGELACPSCNPSGVRPLGRSNLSLISNRPSFAPLPQPNNLVPDRQGTIFFESQDVLSPRDSNGRIEDVYEWEPDGVGGCNRPDGCTYLVSSGHSANDSMFMNATPSGSDVFFITREQLLPQDKDERLDLYDARVGGGIPTVGTAPCGPEACKGPLAVPPVAPSAGSAEFRGPGNPRPACKKGFVKKKGKCVKRKQRKHKKQKKADAKRDHGGAE